MSEVHADRISKCRFCDGEKFSSAGGDVPPALDELNLQFAEVEPVEPAHAIAPLPRREGRLHPNCSIVLLLPDFERVGAIQTYRDNPETRAFGEY
jgi:hypothetical protein